ncbi:Sec-independent protein translocase subunit TatA/TatB [Thermophilibacter immobilis]|uniref:Sec-independent protein translocase protein TatA n=1 Tax=Thermophilibacter immobilis TaxID=2779519 RepID=A0A7S7M854_9ACTN|nr:twin-arginine translocase TatA/TatE family subunit [Thermophilibacter immobilis]QOY60515.1 twin-arginine translocase TatA/TatE family subunit [Thermophilibacter immobilis]
MILGMGPLELILILVAVLLIFGPKNLPKIGSALGKTVKNVREGMDEGKDDEKSEPDASADDSVEVIADEDDADAPVEGAPAEGGQFCPKCGAHNAAGAGFCAKCGAKLGSDE